MTAPAGPASLTSALLVRKGTAVPAAYAALGSAARAARPLFDLAPAEPPAADAGAAVPRPRRRHAALDPRARISLRLDSERYLRLKLSAAHLRVSLQELIVKALDGHLEQIGPAVMNGKCVCLEGGCSTRGHDCEQKQR
jgi:hypothetical protein